MVAVAKKKIKEHMSLNEINKEIKKRKIDASIMRRLIFVKSMFETGDVQVASKIVGIAPSTGYEWLKRWNKEGISGLTPKFAGGKPSRLSEEDFKILDKILENTPNLTTDIAQEIIKVNFMIKYSERQVQRILRKLNYTYTKPYMIYAKMPDDAEEQLQKTWEIDPDEDIYGFDDESRFNNRHNTGKTWHKKGKKNTTIKTLNRESINVIGYHTVNGNNVLSFPERTNRVTFSLHLFDVRETNMENLEVREKLININGSNKVNEEYIENELKKNKFTTEELKEKIHEAAEKPAETDTALEKRMNRLFGKVKVKRKVVVDMQEEGLNDLLDENNDLKEELSKEPRIVMVLDNYSAHLSHSVRRTAKFLNIKLVFLPTHSPKLNPIEQVWRAMKKKISSIDFKCLTELSNKLKFYYYKYVKDRSFTEEWIKKFISKS